MTGKFIKWDNGGGFGRDDWRLLFEFIEKYAIESVLEYGAGLSTELLMAIGMDLTTIETDENYADIPGAQIIVAPYPHYPEMTRHYDLAFVDGPGAYEFEIRGRKPERAQSVRHAMQYANFIYLHDGGLGQEEILDKDPAWDKIRGGDTNLIYQRIL